MAAPSGLISADYEALVAELRTQNSRMEIGFSVYAQTVKHHSLLLGRLQGKNEELEEKVNELQENERASREAVAAVEDAENTRVIDETRRARKQSLYAWILCTALTLSAIVHAAMFLRTAAYRGRLQLLEAELGPQCSNMQAEFSEYAQTSKNHSLLLDQLRKGIGELIQANTKKDLMNYKVAEDKLKMTAAIEDLEKAVNALQTMDKERARASSAADDVGRSCSLADRTRDTRELLTGDEKKMRDKSLWDAAQKGITADVKILLTRGAHVDVKNSHGATPLLLASYNGHLETVQLLIEKGANLNLPNASNETALYWAAADNQLSIVHTLISAGADVNIKDIRGNTALDAAEKRGNSALVDILKAKGAKKGSQL